jgi:glycosyltransferase involved in cell wall biosynthesis
MRLLITTQAVNLDDPVLGFFHGWIGEFSKRAESISVICLKEGRHSLPANVSVLSLGKESGASRATYLFRFYRNIWRLRGTYDAVFVHMNPEYVVLGGLLWRLMGKRVYLWRNHWSSGILTDLAVALSHTTFCTSKSSYIARYTKNILMPVGIATDAFTPSDTPRPRSILSLGRIAPSKNIHVMLAALKILEEKGIEFTASIYGDALEKDGRYLAAQKNYVAHEGLSDRVSFFPGVSNRETPALYASHQIFVNASASGMFDKTIFEALSCGALSIASSADYADFAGEKYTFVENDADSLARKLEEFLEVPAEKRAVESQALRERVEAVHSLRALTDKLVEAMCAK